MGIEIRFIFNFLLNKSLIIDWNGNHAMIVKTFFHLGYVIEC